MCRLRCWQKLARKRTLNSPTKTVWEHAGNPDALAGFEKYLESGKCSLCGAAGQVVAVKRLVSNRFTNWEDYSNADKPVWCNICAWSFTEKNNRSEALFISPERVYSGYQVQSLREMFYKPLSGHTALVVALKKNKHVLPYAQWGTVRIEDMNITWTKKESTWAQSIGILTAMGFALGDIKKDESPSFATVLKLNPQEASRAYELWQGIEPVRKNIPLFSLLLEIHKSATMPYRTIH